MNNQILDNLCRTAENLSLDKPYRVWFVLNHTAKQPIAVIEPDMKRFLRTGYTPVCCFYQGIRHLNAQFDKRLGKYVFADWVVEA